MSPKDNLDNHLGDTVTTQSLASNESLTLDTGQCVEGSRDKQNDGSDDKAGRLYGDRDPLDDTHGKVDCGAHVIGLKSADEGVKRGRRRADAQEERDFNKEDDERADKAYHSKQDDPVEEEDVANAETEAQHHADDAGPLTVYTEVTRPELLCDGHLVGLANAEAKVLCSVATAGFVWQSIGSKAVLFGMGEWLGPSKL